MEKIIKRQIDIGGRILTFELGRFAAQANASVLAQYGETVVLATVVSSSPREDLDYFPLVVEYREKYYAGGRISTSRFVKRERRPRDDEVLTARLIDRSIRPLFPKGFQNEVQVIVTVLSYDGENDPGLLGLVATSAAIAVSDIPWNGPVGAVRVGILPNSKFIINPKNGELSESPLNLVVSGTKDAIVMIEAAAREVEEEKISSALSLAQEKINEISSKIAELAKKVGREKQAYEFSELPEKLINDIRKFAEEEIQGFITKTSLVEGGARDFSQLKEGALEKFGEDYSKLEIQNALQEVFKDVVRRMILSGKRPDGRKPEEVRELEMSTEVLPRTHGSAMFRRGDTQVLSVVTLGAPSLEQWIESMEGEERKRYIHHYNMPPYSIGETGRLGWPARREIGHGALAERAVFPVIPSKEDFPYTIRVVSEVMSSYGSTSMAAVCGSSLALMDAGVKILSPVTGVAMGLITDGKERVILTDITGLEDMNGDMDFKVAGTQKGITALQMDVKISTLTKEILVSALENARQARLEILMSMKKVLPQAKTRLSPYAPKIKVLHVDPSTIGDIIGPGGRVIREMIAKTEAGIDVEDDGTVTISGETEETVAKASQWIEGITTVVKVGDTYEGEVVRIETYGAFVQIAPGKEGLVHVSEMAPRFVRKAADVVKLGQKVRVRVAGIDELGRIKLSMLFDRTSRSGEQQRSYLSSSRVARGRRTIRRKPRR
jgi:polyribonucleotide nucleotidyltransferase